jgi:hypothetical protein
MRAFSIRFRFRGRIKKPQEKNEKIIDSSMSVRRAARVEAADGLSWNIDRY